MTHEEMDALVAAHLEAEASGDPAGCVAMYTDDVEHDVVGAPTGPVHGPGAAQGFYEYLHHNVATEQMEPVRSYYGEDFCVVEHRWTGTVPGEFLGMVGNGRRASARMLHIWEFRDGRIGRENVWIDGGSLAAQLTP